NIFRKLAEHSTHQRDFKRDLKALKQVILTATTEVGRPTFFSMLIIITAHIPIFTLQRHEGRIFSPMAWTVTSALVGSLLFSLTLVPLLCFYLLRRNLPHKDNRIVLMCKRFYRPALAWTLGHRKAVLGLAVAALGVSLGLVPRLGTEFLPELNEGTIWVNANMPAVISLSETTALCARMRAALRKIPEVNSVISKAGRPEDGTDPKPLNMAEIFVDLKPTSRWKRNVTKDSVIEEMDRELDKIPGIETSFSQPIRDNVLESISQ